MVQVMSWGDRGSHCKLNGSCPPIWPNPNTPHVQACLCGLIAGWHPGCLTWVCMDDISKTRNCQKMENCAGAATVWVAGVCRPGALLPVLVGPREHKRSRECEF